MAKIATAWLRLRPLEPHAGADNAPPVVSILFPAQNDSFTSEVFKIKTDATDSDGWIAHVQFFFDTNLIGVVTNPPFDLLWSMPMPCAYVTHSLRAVAVDNLGARSESAPVLVQQACGAPPITRLAVITPPDGKLFAAPATFAFSVELLANSYAGIQFFVGGNLVEQVLTFISATGPPTLITVSNLVEGDYSLSVGDAFHACTCAGQTRTIHVVRLGERLAGLTPDHRLQFQGRTSFPGRQNIIQGSMNLRDWFPISTNYPSSNSFTFIESSPATNAQRFYRLFVPP